MTRGLARLKACRALASLAVGALAATPLLLGRTITVDDDGPAEFRSIQAAINAAEAGDLVSVASGVYSENPLLDCALNKVGVSIVGADSASTTINGGGTNSVARIFDCDSTTRLQGFTLTNGKAEFGGGILIAGGAPVITLNRITGNVAASPLVGFYGYGGGIEVYNSDPLISDNLITGNTADSGGGIDVVCGSGGFVVECGVAAPGGSPVIARNQVTGNRAAFGGAVELYLTDAPIVSNNLITGNTASLPGLYIAFGGGIDVYYGSPVVINNTLVSNTSEIGGGISVFVIRNGNPTVANNIFYNNQASIEGGGMFLEVSSAQVANNLFNRNSPNACGGDSAPLCSTSGNLNADPLFVSVSGSDFRLRAGSPAIDTGLAAGAPPDDVRGQRRPLDGNFNGIVGFDRGAYEYDRNDVLGLRFSTATLLAWDAAIGATAYHLYSGDVLGLAGGGLSTCRDSEDSNRTDLAFTETRTPPAGTAFGYLVTAVIGGLEQSPGWNSLGFERTQTPRCP